MTPDLIKSFVQQLDAVVAKYQAVRGKSKHDDLSDLKGGEAQAVVALARAAIVRIAGTKSAYYTTGEEVIGKATYSNGARAAHLLGVVEALREDLIGGYLRTVEELVHASMFADFLEMAEHLADEGYKDAAAVIAGSSLEAHLRNLCAKHAIPVTSPTAGGVKPKKADTLNAELSGQGAYGKLDQKSVTAWLDLRNKAAHGKYAEYTEQQVELLIASVRDFITRNPA